MSIQTELARIKGAKADLKSWVEENGVTVPDGTLIDGLVELAKTVETGGGGGDTQIDGLIDRSITEISNSRVTKIGNYAFYNCTKLTTADFSAVVDIGAFAFQGCTKLITADFPVATNIGSMAFYSCTSLTTTDFPAVTSIMSYAFYNCTSLKTVNFPAAEFIDSSAFRNCTSLTTTDFPAAHTINDQTFYGCTALTALIIRTPNQVCMLSNKNAFTSTPIASGTGYIYVPSTLVNSYKAATNWATYADQIRAIEDYPDITGGVV